MTLVTVPQINPNDEITADGANAGVNAIGAVLNGNLDDENINNLSGTKISSGTTPATAMTDSGNVEKRFDEAFSDYVISGCVWSALTGLNGTMTAGVISVQGKRLTAPAVATRAFTASKDTYVYLDASGLPVYTGEVANGAAAPTQPANTVRTYKIVTSASAITSVEDIRSKPVGLSNMDVTTLWWEEIGRTTLTASGDVLTISGLPIKKYLRVQFNLIATGGNIITGIRFNGDAGNNYNFRYYVSGAAGTANTSNAWASLETSGASVNGVIDLVNVKSQKKTGHVNAISVPVNVGTNVLSAEFWGVWHNSTDAISSITFTNSSTGDYAVGSEIIVLGHD